MRIFRLSFGLRALYVSAFTVLAGNAIQNIYIPMSAIHLGFSPFQVSLLGSFYFFGFVVGCLVVPQYLYSVGHIRTFAAFSALAAVSAIVISLSDSIVVWLPLRLLTGFSLAALYLSIESWISAFSDDQSRGHVISIYRLVDITGALIGQGFLFAATGYEDTLSVVAILLILSLLPISLTQIQMPVLVNAVPDRLREVLKKTYQLAPLSVWGTLLSGVVAGVFWSLIPLFVEGTGHESSAVPLVVSSYLIGGCVLQWPVGIWSDQIDRRKVIAVLCSISMLAALLLTLGAHFGELGLLPLLLLVGFFGAGGIPIYSIAVAHANDWVKSASVVDLSVLLLVSSSLGSVVGPLVAGAFMNSTSPKSFFVILLLSHGLLLLQALCRIVRFPPISPSKKGEYHDLPETTPMIATVAEGSES